MKEKLKKEETDFTQIKNAVARDERLSWKARGIFLYVYSLPENWDFSVKRISSKSEKDGFKATNTGVRELEKYGYLERLKLGDGRKEWHIRFSLKPTSQNGELDEDEPSRQKGNLPKRQLAKKATIYNKDLNSNKDLNINIEDALTQKTKKFIEDLKEAMKGHSIGKDKIEELHKFVSYWTEPNKSRTKIKWELEKTWDMPRRVATWFRNSKNFNKKGDNKYQVDL